MERIVLQKCFYLPVTGFVIFVLGTILSVLAFGGPSVPVERPDRVVLHGAATEAASQAVPVPLTAPAALAAGWTNPAGECMRRQGRFFHKEDEPYVLIYNRDNSLIGIYLYSRQEMPSPPWRFFEARTTIKGIYRYGVLKFPYLGFDHWALPIYFKTEGMPCGGAGGHRDPDQSP